VASKKVKNLGASPEAFSEYEFRRSQNKAEASFGVSDPKGMN
jgi:hypothetical protein